MLKTCKTCGQEKPANLEEFAPNKQCRGGIGPYCRPCYREYQRKYKEKNSTALAKRRREIYAINNGERVKAERERRISNQPLRERAKLLLSGIRDRSKKYGWPIDEKMKTHHFFMKMLELTPNCQCCGTSFRMQIPANSRTGPCDDSPSIDRFDCSVPYTVENITLICWRCNNIKRNYTAKDLEMVASWMKSRKTGKFE